MGIIGGHLGYKILKRLNRGAAANGCEETAYMGQSKLEKLLGTGVWAEIEGRSVIDFGCGSGEHAVEMARRGARRVIGLDIRETALSEAREKAAAAGVSDRCVFTTRTDETADIVVSMDAFEHFDDPAGVLQIMRGLLKPKGYALVVFGPTWYHPLGGHLFSVFPWSHLIFTEQALIRWRADFKHDGATRFGEVEGGLNQMTINRFRRLVAASGFEFDTFETVPINRMRMLLNPLTREFLTAIVRCRLIPAARSEGAATLETK